ncbi:MAG: response regulator [Anaerolineae bacterium]|nr:response regulator [Anaerolineae bacterium]
MDRKILIVDDDKSMARMLTTALKTLPIKVSPVSVPSGEEAMLAVILDRPALMFVDLGLPGMSGWDLLALVRKRNPQMAVILTTGSRDGDVLRRAKEFGVDAVFFKPVEMADLLAKAEELLVLESQQQAAAAPAEQPVPIPAAADEPPVDKPLSYKQIVRGLREALHADTAAVLSDGGHIMVQTGKDLGGFFREGWEIPVMAALSASQSLGKVLNAEVEQQFLQMKTADGHILLLLPVGRHGLLVLLTGAATGALSNDSLEHLYQAQRKMNDYHEPFIIDDTGQLTPLVEEPVQPAELEMEQPEAVEEFDLDLLFSPAPPDADLDAFWDQAADVLEGASQNTGYLNFTQAEQLGLVPEELEED